MIENFRHVGIVVNDIERSLEFYHNILGLSILKKSEEGSLFIDKILKMNGSKLTTWKLKLLDDKIIELLHFEKKGKIISPLRPNDIGMTHFALTVINAEAMYHHLVQHNVEVLSAPEIGPDNYAKVFFCRDFEHNLIEMVEVLN